LKRCNLKSDATPSCGNTVYIGTKLLCTSCSGNYTLVNGICVAAIYHCSSLSSTGQCSACVNNYQLIGNACVQKP